MSIRTPLARRLCALHAEQRAVLRLVEKLSLHPCATHSSIQLLDSARMEILVKNQVQEEAMWRTGYPAVEPHVKAHAEITSYIADLRKEIFADEANRDAFLRVGAQRLGRWLLDHMTTYDHNLARYLASLEDAPLQSRVSTVESRLR